MTHGSIILAAPLAALLLAPLARAEPTRESLRDEVRLVLERQCGACHVGNYQTAIPNALKIYDLAEVEWAARMSAEQFASARGRLAAELAPDGSPNDVTDAERAKLDRYVAAELKHRAARK